MQVHVSPEINEVLDTAVGISVKRGQFFVGVEHLFEALLEQTALLPKAVVDNHLKALQTVLREMAREAWQGNAPSVRGEVFYTPRCANLLNDAAKYAERFRSGGPTPGHLLLAIAADAHAAPSRAMDRLRFDRGQLVQLLEKELTGRQRRPAGQAQGAQAAAAEAEAEEGAAPGFSLETITHDLTQAAREGKLSPAIGRDREIFEILQILTRKTKNNAILVGDAGVGKTKVVEGMAVEAAKGAAEGLLSNYRILELNLSALMTGTQYRGAFEEKVLAMVEELKQSDDIVLFIDEIHLIMGAGATEGSSMDFANLLKPVLARGEIRCIGATTLQEYRKFVEKDPAIERRFQLVRIDELSEEATADVLKKLQPTLEKHHQVRIGSKALKATIALTQRYMPGRKFPDKAIDVLDQACARYRLKVVAARTNPAMIDETILPTQDNKITPHDIRKVISQLTGIPIEEMTAEERRHLRDLEHHLNQRIIGQDEAVKAVVAAVTKSRAGLSDPNRPDAVLLFLGPTGVGKTQLAKLLTDALLGSPNHLVTFDMSEYIEEHSVSRLLGAPPGYVGSDEEGRLSQAVRNNPFSVLLFDEIEKAHPRIFDIFLPIFDEGRLKDSHGQELNFKNCIIIMTTNIGAEVVVRSAAGSDQKELVDELRNHFRPELINRIDEIVPFYPLLFEDVRSILRLAVNELRARLKDKRMGVRMYQRAYEYLAEQGYNPEYGARELRRVMERLVATPISQKILAGEFQPGDMIDVLMEDGELTFRKGAPHRSGKEIAKQS